jgi:hypothetical protein
LTFDGTKGELNMKKEYIVFNQKLAGYLMQKGFVLKRMGKSDKKDSKLNIFFFNESDDLLKSIAEYKTLIK